MKVKFITGYRGVLTQELHYKPGTVFEFDQSTAEALIAEGRAEPVIPEQTEVEATEAAIELSLEHGINLSGVKGSGAGGRILVSDVRKHIE